MGGATPSLLRWRMSLGAVMAAGAFVAGVIEFGFVSPPTIWGRPDGPEEAGVAPIADDLHRGWRPPRPRAAVPSREVRSLSNGREAPRWSSSVRSRSPRRRVIHPVPAPRG